MDKNNRDLKGTKPAMGQDTIRGGMNISGAERSSPTLGGVARSAPAGTNTSANGKNGIGAANTGKASAARNAESARMMSERKRVAEVKYASEYMAFILCGVAVLILVIVGLIAIVAPKPEYSSLEKRELADAPEITLGNITDGTFAKQTDLFFADTFPFREGFISLSGKIRRLFGIRPEGKTYYAGDSDIADESENLGITADTDEIDRIMQGISGSDNAGQTEGDTTGDETSDTRQEEQETPLGEKRGALYIVGDTALEIFGGKVEHAEYYGDVISLHAETYKKYSPDINVYCMVFPTHIEFALPEADKDLSLGQRECIDAIKARLGDKAVFIDPYAELEKAFDRDEYLYFRTDHHWTVRGAYYAFAEFAKAAGFVPKSMEQYSVGQIDEFLGSFYASTTDPALAANPDTVEYFNIDTEYKATYYNRDKTVYSEDETLLYRGISDINNGYLCFTGGDQPYIKIITGNKNGRKLMIFKESYGNPLVTLLVDCYEEIHVADIRSFPYNSAVFAVENGITDVLFVNSVMSASTVARIKDMEKLLTKQ